MTYCDLRQRLCHTIRHSLHQPDKCYLQFRSIRFFNYCLIKAPPHSSDPKPDPDIFEVFLPSSFRSAEKQQKSTKQSKLMNEHSRMLFLVRWLTLYPINQNLFSINFLLLCILSLSHFLGWQNLYIFQWKKFAVRSFGLAGSGFLIYDYNFRLWQGMWTSGTLSQWLWVPGSGRWWATEACD